MKHMKGMTCRKDLMNNSYRTWVAQEGFCRKPRIFNAFMPFRDYGDCPQVPLGWVEEGQDFATLAAGELPSPAPLNTDSLGDLRYAAALGTAA